MSTGKNKQAYTFAERLRAMMNAREIKQVPLAQKVGVSQPAVSGWLRGAMPDAEQLVRISDALEVSVDWLLKGAEGLREEIRYEVKDAPPSLHAYAPVPPPAPRPESSEARRRLASSAREQIEEIKRRLADVEKVVKELGEMENP